MIQNTFARRAGMLAAGTMLLVAGNAYAAGGLTPAAIASRLATAAPYAASAEFRVSMPQLAEDVIYDIELMSLPNGGDRLSPCDYLIRTRLEGSDAASAEGFSAYFDGHHYRYGGERLQEYHMEWDSVPFMPGSDPRRSPGVATSAQFTQLLPQYIARAITEMASDPEYVVTVHADTLARGTRCDAIEARRYHDGECVQETEYLLTRDTSLPLHITYENNPGSISEQTIDVDYGQPSATAGLPETMSEGWLMELYPDVFATRRESNFRVESLTGHQMPQFSLPTPTGERYTREKGAALRTPTIIAVLRPDDGFAGDAVADIRRAADELPYQADAIFAVESTNADQIEQLLGSQREGEHYLMNAQSLRRDCGITSTPTLLLLGSDGTVRNVIIGYNNNLAADVIQKMSLID